MATLFSNGTRWRIDYTGAQHGVDWRRPMPPRDQRGYVLMNSVMSIFEYGTLPEQWISRKRAKLQPLPADFDSGVGIPFLLAVDPQKSHVLLGESEPGRVGPVKPGRHAPARNNEHEITSLRVEKRGKNVLALCCTEPYEQFPSQATLTLDRPRRLEKVYLLTANLVKTLKCYYPAAEIVVHYADGSEQRHQMIPPYTMPSLVSNICPRAHAVPEGTLEGGGNPVVDRRCYLSVTDVVLDPSKPAVSIELRSVTTESLLGLVGATVLEAP